MVLLFTVVIGQAVNTQFLKTTNEKMTIGAVELNDGSEMAKIVVRQYNEKGEIIETIHELSVNEIEDIRDRLQSTCYNGKPIREILEEQLGILREKNIISEEMTVDDILGDKADIIDDINVPNTFTVDSTLVGFHCFVAFLGLGIGGALGTHLVHQCAGVDFVVTAAGYFPFIGYKGITNDIVDWRSGYFVGGMLGFLGLLIFSITLEPKVYAPFVFGVGYTPLTVWIPIPALKT